MMLVVLTVVVIAALVAVLAVFLFAIGALLNRTANNLDDCARNVENIAKQADVIGPAIERINETGTTVIGALPLLCEAAEQIGVAKSAPYVDPSEAPSPSPYYSTPYTARSHAAPSHAAPAPNPAPAPAPAADPAPAAVPSRNSYAVPSSAPAQGVGYLDENRGGSHGYLDG
jgi:HAMP domain-containing protein